MPTHAQREQGFTLIEAMIGVSILAITGVALWGLLNLTLDLIWETKAKTGASAIANQYMEIARNLPYVDVGTVGGIPAGSMEQTEQKTLNNITYTITTSVVYEDDPFDGTLPTDLLPADYKVVRVEVSWPFKIVSSPIVFVSKIAPKGLESEAGGGTIRITVLDALGLPIPQANVHIENTDISPTVDLNIVTDNNGQVLLPGALPSVEGYDITVTKAGFSTDLTYEVDPVNLPTPVRPPLTVVEGTLTEATFSIDRTSTVIVSTINAGDTSCEITHNLPGDTDVRIAGVKTSSEEIENEEDIEFHIAAGGTWWHTDWQHRRRLTLDNSAQTDTHNDTPVYVYLDVFNFDFAKAQANGEDIRFVDDDDITSLSYEIERWDNIGQEASIWVKVPQIDGGTTDDIWMYYNNTAASDGQSATDVWSSGFEMVHHLSDDPGPGNSDDIQDSTSNNHDGTAESSMTTGDLVGGIAGNAIDFDGTDDTIDISDHANLRPGTGPYTLEAWFNVPDINQIGVMAGKIELADPRLGIAFAINGDLITPTPGQRITAAFASDTTSNIQQWFPITDVADAAWHYAALSITSGNGSFYLDGISQSIDNNLGSPNPQNTNVYSIGNSNDLFPLDGVVDEVRVSTVARSADWVTFQNCSIRQTCITYAAEEAKPGNDIYIAGDTGSDTTGDGSSGNPYQTLTRGLQDIITGAGSTIHLKGGLTYAEGPLTLSGSHSGATSTPTTIRSWTGTATATVQTLGVENFDVDSAKHITLSRIALTGSSGRAVLLQNDTVDFRAEYLYISGAGTSAIYDNTTPGYHELHGNTIDTSGLHAIVLNSDNSTISGNILTNNTGSGIDYYKSGNNTISNNTITGNSQYGIRLQGIGNNSLTVDGNTITGNTLSGIFIESNNNTISNNTISSNLNNGVLVSSDDNTISGNTIASNTLDGLFSDGTDGNIISSNTIHTNANSGLDVINITSITISDNTVYNNSSRGIGIQDNSANVTTSGNRVYNNATGIHVKSATSITLQNNVTFSNSQYGIAVIGGSDNVQILSNTVTKNTLDGIALDQASSNTVITNNIIALNTGWGLTDVDNASEPTDTYNLFYNNTAGHMNNLTPSAGGTGTIVDTDPLFVNSGADNYHLQSVKGYYPFGPSDTSANYSPALDVGDAASTYTIEPVPNGCRINLGGYGNTIEASKSPEGGAPIPNISFTMRGTKLIGWDGGGAPVYKYEQAHQTGGDGTITLTDIEWDSYTFVVDEIATGYDVAYTDPYQPSSILPNTSPTITLGLAPDTAYSAHVVVIDVDSDPIDNAQVRLYDLGIPYDTTIVTPAHGQAFFPSLTNNTYTLEIGKENFTTSTQSLVVDDDVSTIVTLTEEGAPPPLTPPDAPTVTGFSGISETGITINWTDNANNEDGYRIYYDTVNTKPGSAQATLAANSITHPVSSLTCGTLYYWWVEAYNTEGSADHTGAPSQQSTSSCPTPPAAPTIQSFSGISETTMTINWLDNANNEDEYRIYRDTVATKPGTPLTTLAADATSYDGTGMVCNTTYHWWVEAYNTQGTADDTASQSTNACAPTEVFSDFFTEGSNTVLSSHTPDAGTGWTRIIEVTNEIEGGGNSRIGVNGNNDQLRDNGWCGGDDGALYQTDDLMPGANYEVSVTQINGDTGSRDFNVLAARIQDANNMYALKWNESSARLYKRTTVSGWQSISSQVGGVTDGSTVTLKVDGTTISAIDDGNTILSVTDSSHSGAGRAGVGMGAVITPTDRCSGQRLDDFSVSTT